MGLIDHTTALQPSRGVPIFMHMIVQIRAAIVAPIPYTYYTTPPSPRALPLHYLSRLRPLHANNLIAVQQAQRVEGELQPPHRVHGRLAEFVGEVIALDKADAVLAGCCALKLDGALDHAVDDFFGDGVLGVVPEQDGWANGLAFSRVY